MPWTLRRKSPARRGDRTIRGTASPTGACRVRGLARELPASTTPCLNREIDPMLSRRVLLHLPLATLAGSYALNAFPADKTITIGINLPLTGADAHDAELIKDGAMLALDEANAQGGVAGYKINVTVLDDGTATAGQYDPAQG